MADVSASVDISVHGAGSLQDAAAAARELAKSLKDARDAAGEIAGSFGAAAKSLGSLRNAAAEAAKALKSIRDSGVKLGEIGTGAEAAAEGLARVRDDAAEAAAALKAVKAPSLGRSAVGAEAYAEALGKVRDNAAEAALAQRGISSGAGGLFGGRGGRGGGSDVERLAHDAENADNELGRMGKIMGGLGSLDIPVMAAGIGALVEAVVAVTPGVLSLGAGFGSFGLLAAPALEKVKNGLTAVTAAQAKYHTAQVAAERDPTKANLKAEQKALTSLQNTWAGMPKPIAASVRSIQQFGHAFSQASAKSGIQKDFLHDIPKALKAAQDAIPSLVSLAKGAAPVISNMLGALDKQEKSAGFLHFISSLKKDMGPAAASFKQLGGAVGGFISQLVGKGAGPGNQFVKSVSQLIKTVSPGLVTAAVNGIKLMTGAINGLNTVLNSPVTKGAGHILDNIFKGFGKAASGLEKASEFSISKFWKPALTGSWEPPWLKEFTQHGFAGKAAQVPVKVTPHLDKGALAKSLSPAAGPLHIPVAPKPVGGEALRRSLTGSAGPLSIPVHPKVDKGALRASLTAGGPMNIPVTAKIHVDKAALAKSLTAGGLAPPSVNAKAKITHADASGVKDAKVPATAKVDKVDTSGIQAAAKNVKIHGVTVDLSSAKLSGLGALSGAMSAAGASAGRAFDSGLTNAIQSGGGAAVGAARAIVGQIRGALSGMAAAGNAAGSALGAGLAAGIRAGTGAAVAAATAMANAVTSAVKAAHATQSPSKVFKGIGKNDAEGLAQGLEGGKAAVQQAAKDLAVGTLKPFNDKTIADTMRKLESDLAKALKDKKITGGEDSAISSWLKSDTAKLQQLAGQRKDLESQIQAADSLFKSVQSSAIEGGNIVTLAGNVKTEGERVYEEEQGTDPGPVNQSVQSQLKKYIGQVRAFKNDIVKLKKEGLDKTSIKQLLQAGVTTGLPAAKTLLSGGPGGVKEVAQLQNQLAKAAKQLGVTGANAAYESGADIGKGLAAGLKSALSGVEASIKDLAKSIVKALKGGKDGKSLAELGKDLGKQFADGVGKGAAEAHKKAAGGKLVSPHVGAGGGVQPMPIIVQGGGNASGPGQVINVHVNLDGKEIANAVQTYTLQRAHRNTGSGLKLAGRSS